MTSSELTNDQVIDLISDYKNFKIIVEAVSEGDRRRSPTGRDNNSDLSKISNVQFWQLATDVNNELMKRLTNSKIHESHNENNLKRGEAQSKLSCLNDSRFHNLIFDLFMEIEKRNLHNLDAVTHANTLDKGALNFYLTDSLFESINISDDFVTADGIIPIEAFQELRSQFVLYFQNTLHRNHAANAIGRLPILLEIIFRIADLIGKLLPLLSSPSQYDSLEKEIIYLKSALSHSITSTRYYLTYGDLIPRVVIQSSISEVIFAFCNIAQIAKIKSTEPSEDTLLDEREPDDTETAMKPLKIIEKVKNKQNDKNKVLLGNSATSPDSLSSFDKANRVVLSTSKESPAVEVSPSICNIETLDALVKKSELLQSNASRDLSFFNEKTDTNSPTAKNKSSSRDPSALKATSILDSSVSQNKVSTPTSNFRKDYHLSPLHLKKAAHDFDTSSSEKFKSYTNTSDSSSVPESPSAVKVRRFKEKVKQFGSNYGLGLRISTSGEDVKNSQTKPNTNMISMNDFLEFVESRTTVVVPMVQDILSGIQDPKSKTLKTARSISRLRQDSIKITPILKSMIGVTSKVLAQENSKPYLSEQGKWIVENLTDCLRRLSALCAYGRNFVNFSDKQFYRKLASILFDVIKCTEELVKCVKFVNEQTAP